MILFYRLHQRLFPNHPQSLLFRAEKAIERRAWGPAFELSNAAAQQHESLPWAFFLRALARLGLDDHAGALRDIGLFLAMEEEPAPVVYYWRGWLYCQRGDWSMALSDFDRALPFRDPDPNLHYWRGYAQWQLGQWEAMARTLGRLDQLQPDRPRVAELWGHFFLHHGQLPQAEAAYSRALAAGMESPMLRYNRAVARGQLGRHEAAREDLAALLRQEPDNGWGHHEWGHLEYHAGRYESALAHARRAGELLGPGALEPRMQEVAALIALDRAVEALPLLSEMERQHPEAPRVAYLLAELRASRGDLEGAVSAYRVVLRRDPTHPDARLRLADALMGLERFHEAAPLLDELVCVASHAIEARSLRADLYRHTNRPQAMAAELEAILAADPANPWALTYRAAYRQWLADGAGAEADYGAALAADSSQGWIWAFRGDFYHRQGRLELARKDFAQAILLEPENGWIHRQWANLLWSLGQQSLALTVLTSLVSQEPEDGHAWLTLAERLLEVQEPVAAAEALRAVVEQEHELAWMAHAALAALAEEEGERAEHHARAEALRPAASFWGVTPARVRAQQALLAALADDGDGAAAHLAEAVAACEPGERLWAALPPLLERLGASELLEQVPA